MKSLRERFWSKVDKSGDCWLWTGSIANYGYGHIGVGGRNGATLRAHRIAWTWVHGPIPTGMLVLHKCDTPACVKVEHLFLGTQRDNIHDMIAKDRMSCGSRRPEAKLDELCVEIAREIYAGGKFTQQQLADFFGVCRETMRNAINGKTWKHV